MYYSINTLKIKKIAVTNRHLWIEYSNKPRMYDCIANKYTII